MPHLHKLSHTCRSPLAANPLQRARFQSTRVDLLCFFAEHPHATATDFIRAYPGLADRSVHEFATRLLAERVLSKTGEFRTPGITRRQGQAQYVVTQSGIAVLRHLRDMHRSQADRLDHILAS
jgi:hypothetical protein